MRSALAYLAVIGSAAFAGMMICIGFAFGGWWISLPPQDFLAWFSANSRFIARTIPVVAVPAALGLLGSLWLARQDPQTRFAWGGAVIAMVGAWLVTLLYHLPSNAAFVAGTIPPENVPATLKTWLQLHALRIALGLAASAMALHAARRDAVLPA